jgi:cobalt-zinc-cadmium efflux system protein
MNDKSHDHKQDQGHKHDSFAELFEYRNVAQKRLIISLSITLVVMILEIVGGILTGSIALLSDAGHMFTHSFAIAISLVAVFIARKPACHHRTFGLYRSEILAAFINGIMLLFVVGVILYEAIQRILNPGEIDSIQMLGIALIGLAVNVASILILRSGYRSSGRCCFLGGDSHCSSYNFLYRLEYNRSHNKHRNLHPYPYMGY